MKKLLLQTILVALISTGFAISTVEAQSPVSFGIKGGVNFANLNDVSGDPDSRTGLLLGAYLQLDLPGAPFTIQPEVLYSQKGAESTGGDLELDYLEIPVLAKLGFTTPGPVKPHILAGPYLGFVLNAESGGVDVSDQTQTDFGGVLGVGTDINLPGPSLTVDLRYGFGFTDIFENASGKNGIFSIAAGIGF
ncbi:MAG: porin family protein [Balneolaceae bacterium]|nr:porin family protein [Balneolaceae bacterium]